MLKETTITEIIRNIAEARRNLKESDFMFNDDNWIDPRKIEANKELILEIQKYEKVTEKEILGGFDIC